MNTPLVFIESRNGEPTNGSLGLLATARRLAGRCAAVSCGPGSAVVAERLPRYGADEVWFCEDPRLDPDLAQPQVDALAHVMRESGYTTVLFENSTVAGDVAAGLSARFDAGVNWDLQDLAVQGGELVGSRLALNDSVAVDVGWIGKVRLAVFRMGVFEATDDPVASEIHRFEPEIGDHALGPQIVERIDSPEGGTSIGSANVIVSGGRGLRDQASLHLLEELATALGGSVGVSLPLVDRGWYPHSNLVGQTGRIVKPRLYIACGISGALQHRVGMERSALIVAINSDPEAPIFGFCDGGVVGDLHEMVPELTRLLRARTTG